ncbi:MAG: response regulator [Deltaproteobacteria bacterium]|nr:response regulator [Deltaproteobacteria bacterium]
MMMYSQSIVRRVVEEGKAVILSDILGEDEIERSKSMELMKVRSVMCVPLISKAKVWGVIYVDSVNRPFGFRKEDLSLLTTLSGPAAVAIENALLYSNLEEIIEDRTKNLRETQEKLRESEARFKAVFNNMSSGVVVYEVVNDGEDFFIVDLNKAEQKIGKIKKRKALGKSVFKIFPEIKDSGLKEVFKRVWKTGKPEHRAVTLKNDKKETNWREYYVYRLPSGEIVSIFDDISGKKKAEEEQAALQEQLIVSQKMESIGALAGGTAHNFRNILQAISGNIEYLEMIYGNKPEIRELSKSIYDSVEKGVDLINRLLQFSRRGEKYQMVDLDLVDVIKRACEMIERILDKNIEVKLDLEENLFIKGSHSFLSQIFMNLFTNARDAMPDGGRLIIEAGKKRDRVVAIVSDTGHGMDKKTMENIFDPFFTLKEVGKGTGLGLSTTHGIVEQHGGSISVSSQPGKGTRFEIRFPLVKTEEIAKPKVQDEVIFGNGQKVLIVDDERSTLDSLSNLIKVLGYKAISIDKPVEALKNYGKWGPDVVLMDRSMPKMDGITCIKEIMKTDPKAKIIIVSGYAELGPNGIDDNVKSLIKGYLTKPCGMQELSSALSQALKA